MNVKAGHLQTTNMTDRNSLDDLKISADPILVWFPLEHIRLKSDTRALYGFLISNKSPSTLPPKMSIECVLTMITRPLLGGSPSPTKPGKGQQEHDLWIDLLIDRRYSLEESTWFMGWHNRFAIFSNEKNILQKELLVNRTTYYRRMSHGIEKRPWHFTVCCYLSSLKHKWRRFSHSQNLER